MLKMLVMHRQFLIWRLHSCCFHSQAKSGELADEYASLCEDDIEQLKSFVNSKARLSTKVSTAKRYYSNYIFAKFKYPSLYHSHTGFFPVNFSVLAIDSTAHPASVSSCSFKQTHYKVLLPLLRLHYATLMQMGSIKL